MREKVCQAAASMVNGAKAASRRVSPLHPGVMQSVALQLLEAGEAGLDVSHDATKFSQIAPHDMWLQPSEERFDLTPVPVHEAGDVGFVNRYTVKLALSVKRGQRIEFEQDQTFRRGGRHVQLGKPVGGAEVLLRLGKEGIGSQRHIHSHCGMIACSFGKRNVEIPARTEIKIKITWGGQAGRNSAT